MTGVIAAELRWHLSNMNVIFNRQPVFWYWRKIANYRIVLVPPTHDVLSRWTAVLFMVMIFRAMCLILLIPVDTQDVAGGKRGWGRQRLPKQVPVIWTGPKVRGDWQLGWPMIDSSDTLRWRDMNVMSEISNATWKHHIQAFCMGEPPISGGSPHKRPEMLTGGFPNKRMWKASPCRGVNKHPRA